MNNVCDMFQTNLTVILDEKFKCDQLQTTSVNELHLQKFEKFNKYFSNNEIQTTNVD